MVKLLKQLTPEFKVQVSEIIGAAERKTSAEIIPVVVAKAGDYGYSRALFAFLFSLVTLSTCWILFQAVAVMEDGWGSVGLIAFGLIPILISSIVGFGIGNLIASAFPVLVRPFVTSKIQRVACEMAAVSAFHRFKLTRTKSRTGVLICVCLFERRVVVLGDKAISEKLTQSDWDKARDQILAHLKKSDLAGGITAGIETAGELLSKHFPADPDNADEVTNELRVLN